MRSEKLCQFEKSVSELNTHLSHTLFVFSQFEIDNQTLVNKKSEQLTTRVYGENPMSPQFNVKLKTIIQEAAMSRDYILDTFFVFINTHFEIFLVGLYNLMRTELDFPGLTEPPKSQLYKSVLERLDIDPVNDLSNLAASTYDYYKYRRNATMHRDKKKRFHGALKDLVKGKKNDDLRPEVLNGVELNKEWGIYANQNPGAHSIRNTDFTKTELASFSLEELLDVFNFFRLYAKLIDAAALKKIDQESLLKYLIVDFKINYPMYANMDFEKFVIRFRRIAQIRLNLPIEISLLEKIYKKI